MNVRDDSLCMRLVECLRVSRMRETCQSGLKRGEAAATLPLSYSTRKFPPSD
jgi:hypothetical protein